MKSDDAVRQSDRSDPPSEPTSPAYEAFLARLADVAAAAILPHFRSTGRVDNKDSAGFDPVTEADRAAEMAIRAAIAAEYPEHGIIGEEHADKAPDAEAVWVIDPIDGTRSFIAGIPIWGVLIGLMERGKPRLGMMAQPFTGERYVGAGQSARYEGPGGPRTLRTRPCAAIEEAVVFTTAPDLFSAAEAQSWQRIAAAARLARYGTDCYAYCMVAAGSVDAVVEAGLKPHDILPLIPILEGAGGIVTDWQGNPDPREGNVVASGDARLHEQILAILAG